MFPEEDRYHVELGGCNKSKVKINFAVSDETIRRVTGCVEGACRQGMSIKAHIGGQNVQTHCPYLDKEVSIDKEADSYRTANCTKDSELCDMNWIRKAIRAIWARTPGLSKEKIIEELKRLINGKEVLTTKIQNVYEKLQEEGYNHHEKDVSQSFPIQFKRDHEEFLIVDTSLSGALLLSKTELTLTYESSKTTSNGITNREKIKVLMDALKKVEENFLQKSSR